MNVVYEDNHIIIVNKQSGEIVQGDKTGDTPLSDIVKQYIKDKYNKPGNVFLGVVHRLDRPVSGLVVFAKTSKALSRLNEMFRTGDVHKTYWAIVKKNDIAQRQHLPTGLHATSDRTRAMRTTARYPEPRRRCLATRCAACRTTICCLKCA